MGNKEAVRVQVCALEKVAETKLRLLENVRTAQWETQEKIEKRRLDAYQEALTLLTDAVKKVAKVADGGEDVPSSLAGRLMLKCGLLSWKLGEELRLARFSDKKESEMSIETFYVSARELLRNSRDKFAERPASYEWLMYANWALGSFYMSLKYAKVNSVSLSEKWEAHVPVFRCIDSNRPDLFVEEDVTAWDMAGMSCFKQIGRTIHHWRAEVKKSGQCRDESIDPATHFPKGLYILDFESTEKMLRDIARRCEYAKEYEIARNFYREAAAECARTKGPLSHDAIWSRWLVGSSYFDSVQLALGERSYTEKEAEERFKADLDYYRSLGAEENPDVAYYFLFSGLCNVYKVCGRSREYIETMRRAEEILENASDWARAMHVYKDIGNYYRGRNMLAESISAYKRVIDLSHRAFGNAVDSEKLSQALEIKCAEAEAYRDVTDTILLEECCYDKLKNIGMYSEPSWDYWMKNPLSYVQKMLMTKLLTNLRAEEKALLVVLGDALCKDYKAFHVLRSTSLDLACSNISEANRNRTRQLKDESSEKAGALYYLYKCRKRMADVLARLGEYSSALSAYEEVAEAAPWLGECWYDSKLIELYKCMGLTALAAGLDDTYDANAKSEEYFETAYALVCYMRKEMRPKNADVGALCKCALEAYMDRFQSTADVDYLNMCSKWRERLESCVKTCGEQGTVPEEDLAIWESMLSQIDNMQKDHQGLSASKT